MVPFEIIFVLTWTLFVPTNSKKSYGDMFPHKHKPPIPFPIPGWEPDTKPWDESLYPPFKPELTRRHGKIPRVRLTSDSPAINGSCVSFTAALEFPPCQKEDAYGKLVYDEHCDDANGQLPSGYVGWLEDYGFRKCTDLKRCNVFPDGKPFPQTSDRSRKGYVYVWHTMGQYFETCDGSSSHLTLNTTNMTFGAGVMEVMVYRKRERRKYTPLSTDSTVYFITDKIPLSVNISQKEAIQIQEKNVFVRGSDVIFKVQIHDPSNYLKTADAVDFIWDFRDGNQLVTHSNVAIHAYDMLGNVTVKLLVEAMFRIPCPPPTPTAMHFTQARTTAVPTPPPHETHTFTSKTETTKAPIITNPSPTTARAPTSAVPTTESFQTDADVTSAVTATPVPETSPTHSQPISPSMIRHTHSSESNCFRYLYGSFEGEVIIIEPPLALYNELPSKILNVSSAEITNTSVNFVVTCSGSVPSVACTVVADSTCREINNILCEDASPSGEGCKISLTRIFQTPGTYCVNITLGLPGGLALATTSVTIGNQLEKSTPKSTHLAEVVLSSSAVLISIFTFIAIMIYKRYKVYRPVRRSMFHDAERNSGVESWSLSKLRSALFPANEERSRLLTEKPL